MYRVYTIYVYQETRISTIWIAKNIIYIVLLTLSFPWKNIKTQIVSELKARLEIFRCSRYFEIFRCITIPKFTIKRKRKGSLTPEIDAESRGSCSSNPDVHSRMSPPILEEDNTDNLSSVQYQTTNIQYKNVASIMPKFEKQSVPSSNPYPNPINNPNLIPVTSDGISPLSISRRNTTMGFLKPNSNDTRLKLQSTGAASATSRTRLESRQVFYKDAFKPNEGVKGTQV